MLPNLTINQFFFFFSGGWLSGTCLTSMVSCVKRVFSLLECRLFNVAVSHPLLNVAFMAEMWIERSYRAVAIPPPPASHVTFIVALNAPF